MNKRYTVKLTKDEESKSIKAIIESGELLIPKIGKIKVNVMQNKVYGDVKFFRATVILAKGIKKLLKTNIKNL